ncbi:MAG: ATP-binding cassette domain-containing protein [Cytophagaceae bacterium]|jgi:ATPase subunit of ABC transporter with duplicated ATPase domains|nr:ATP-binding cassette domain-containing protein [Cytophagaceae bacterium]
MIGTENLSLRYGKRVLFEEVNVKFAPGNCYGLIGANGAGKSTFLKILSGEIDPTTGKVVITPGERMAVLKQNQYEFDENQVLETVIMGHKKLYSLMKEKDALYAKEDFSEADGVKASELEEQFAELNGWNAESEAAELLSGLGVKEHLHYLCMKELDANDKVRVLLAQALFGNPDILLLDEPTNNLSIESVRWLENFLYEFKNTVIVVSHDRHFLDQVCTHIADIDFGKLQLYTGNYSFWYESSQLAVKQRADQNKKIEDKRKELQDFIARFSANASKSKQATSRQKLLEKLTVEDIKPSSRKYPAIFFKPEREPGDQILKVENLSAHRDGTMMFQNVSFSVGREDKIAFISKEPLAISTFFDVINGEHQAQGGSYKWGVTITNTYFPRENSRYFASDLNLIDWLRQYSEEKDESFIRTFLGRMLFTGEESLKSCKVLSGGEKVRCMLSKMMMSGANSLVMDDPTNHLDLESITSLNNGMKDFKGVVLFYSHDYELIQTVANRIIEITPKGIIDKMMTYEEYLENERVKEQQEELYAV